jgi:hypothetical protein
LAAPVPQAAVPPVQVQSPPVSQPSGNAAAVPAPAKPKPARTETAPLTVTSEPWGTLYLDDLEIGPTPVADYPLPQGRHRLRIEQEGYSARTEIIFVTGPNPIRRQYNLEPAGPQ